VPDGAPRRTLRRATDLLPGVGLFTAARSTARILPAPSGGLRFLRVDLPGSAPVPATLASISDPPAGIPTRNTTLAAPGGVSVLTVEHILSALAGAGITDAVIEVGGPEVPILDGSAAEFARVIDEAGIASAPGTVRPIVIDRPITVEHDGASITVLPGDGSIFRYELDYGPGAPIPAQAAEIDLAAGGYGAGVAPARTFCLEAEARAMRAAGLFGHLTAREMLVIGPGGPVDNSYRFPDEPARHKLLDLIGDLALAGRPIVGRVVAARAGHALNHRMARRLAEMA
jgi:UDP-3-O-acyl N-acetylglucosamine deacetylase